MLRPDGVWTDTVPEFRTLHHTQHSCPKPLYDTSHFLFFIVPTLKTFLKRFSHFYMYGCFICMYVCAPQRSKCHKGPVEGIRTEVKDS